MKIIHKKISDPKVGSLKALKILINLLLNFNSLIIRIQIPFGILVDKVVTVVVTIVVVIVSVVASFVVEFVVIKVVDAFKVVSE